MDSERAAAARLIERLLTDPVLRSRFRSNPVGIARDAGLELTAEELEALNRRPMQTLDVRESRSSLAGALMAAALEGVAIGGLAAGGSLPGSLGGADQASAAPLDADPRLASGETAGGGDELRTRFALRAVRQASTPEDAAAARAERGGARVWESSVKPSGADSPAAASAVDSRPAAADSSEPVRAAAEVGGSGASPEDAARALLQNRHVTFDAEGIADLKAGRIDPRVATVLNRLGERHRLTISVLESGHSQLTAGGSVSNHSVGRAVDIATVDGETVGPGSQAARKLVDELPRLDPAIRPSEIGSPWQLSQPGSFTDAAHQNHIHLGYDDALPASWKPPVGTDPSGGAEVDDDLGDTDDLDDTGGDGSVEADESASVDDGSEDGGSDDEESDDSGDDEDEDEDEEDEDEDDEDEDDEDEGESDDEQEDDEEEDAEESDDESDEEGDDEDDGGSDDEGGGASDDGETDDDEDDGESDDDEDDDDSDDDESDGGDSDDGGSGGGLDDEIAPGASGEYPGDNAPRERVAAWMAAEARRRGLPGELPVMAALVESNMRNLNYGDADSVGFFQMRSSIWDKGEYAGYSNRPELQLKWFLDHAVAIKRERVSQGLPVDDPRQYGDWVANVEMPASAYRGRYQLQFEEAHQLVERGGRERGGGDGGQLELVGDAVGPGRRAAAALAEAKRYLGTPYRWGGSSPQTGFDCSGLVQWAYAKVGIKIPRVTDQQILASNGTPVPRKRLIPGDLVFFRDSSGYVHHVGISLGGDKFIHAPHTGDVVKVSSLKESYYADQFAGGRRFDKSGGAASAASAASAGADEVGEARAALESDAEQARTPGTLIFRALDRQESSWAAADAARSRT